MKSKVRTIIALGVIVLVVLSTAVIILLSGSKNGGFNYARVDMVASIEYVTDNRGRVVAYRPLNDNARIVLAGVEVNNEKISDVIGSVLNESLKVGLLDLDRDVIPIKITTIGRLTHSFDIKVYEAVNEFLLQNQIMGLIVENTNDMEIIRKSKELGVSPNEYMLIDSIAKYSNIPSFTLKKKMPDELIDIIMDIDDKYISDYPISQEEYSVKEDLMAKYYETYDYHQNSISDSTIRDYMENRSEIKRLYQRKLELGRDISIN